MKNGTYNFLRWVCVCVCLVAGAVGPLVGQTVVVAANDVVVSAGPPAVMRNGVTRATFSIGPTFNRAGGTWQVLVVADVTRGGAAGGVVVGGAVGGPSVNANGSITSTFNAAAGTTITVQATISNSGTVTTNSGTLQIPPIPPLRKSAIVPLQNGSQIDVTYKFYVRNSDGTTDFSKLVKTQVVRAGESVDLLLGVNGGQDLNVWAEAQNATESGGQLVPGSGLYTWFVGSIMNANMTTVPDGQGSTSTNATPAAVQNVNQNSTAPQNVATNSTNTATVAGGTIFKTATETAATGSLTAGVFATGINGLSTNIVTALDRVNNSIRAQTSTGGGGGATDMTATNAKLDTVADRVKVGNDLDKVVNDRAEAANSSLTTQAASEAARIGSAASATESAARTRILADIGARGTFDSVGVTLGSGDVMVDLSSVGWAANFNLNPIRNPAMPTWAVEFAAWCRSFIGWGTVLALIAYVSYLVKKDITDVLLTQKQAPFTLENGAYALSVFSMPVVIPLRIGLVAALSAIVIAMPSAIIQVFSSEWMVLLNSLRPAAASGGGIIGTVSAVANDYVPVLTLLSVGITYASIHYALLPVKFVWQWVIRFTPL